MPLLNTQPDALARLYAASLFELAQADGGQSRVEETLNELEEILELTRTNFAFGEFLGSRILPVDARARSLETIFKGKINDLTLRFLLVVNQKERLAHLPAIAAAFDEMIQHAFGRVEVDVYTAEPAGEEDLSSIRARLHSLLGKQPVLHAYTDPDMIGGVKLQIGDQLIDASIAASLRRMRDRLAHQGADELRAAADRIMD